MSDVNSQSSPAKGRGRGSRRNATKSTPMTSKVTKRTATGKRGRHKAYDSALVQASVERQKELKSAYSQLAGVVKSALEDLADRNLELLRTSENAHKEVDAYEDVIGFLDQRLEDQIRQNDAVADARRQALREKYDAFAAVTRQSYQTKMEEAIEEMMDVQLAKLDRLEYLWQNGLPLDTPDDSYDLRPLPAHQVGNLGAYVKMVDGVPHPYNKQDSNESQGRRGSLPKTPSKRKATGEAEGAPVPKRPASAAQVEEPRHIGGMLSAETAPEGGESKMPSPVPGEGVEDEPLPVEEEITGQLPPLPAALSAPDEQGFRVVTKRLTRESRSNGNKIMAPAWFEFEDHEIGFRDSTNDKSKGATRAKRGKYLDDPSSNTFHFDRVVWGYDATENEEGDLDQDLVRMYKLHPTYGIFTKDSVNPDVPPKPFVSGKKPVVFHDPAGRLYHTSRSVHGDRMDRQYEIGSRRMEIQSVMEELCAQEGISPEDVAPTEEMVEQHRKEKLKDYVPSAPRPHNPPVFLINPPEIEQEEDHDEQEAAQAEAAAHKAATQATSLLLDAAAASDAEEARTAASVAPAPARASSRAFDPVRDINPQPISPPADAPRLEMLAAIASEEPRAGDLGFAPGPSTVPPPPQRSARHASEMLNEDGPSAYEPRPESYQQQAAPSSVLELDPRLFADSAASEGYGAPAPPPPPSFLHTAMNHSSSGYAPIAPQPSSYPPLEQARRQSYDSEMSFTPRVPFSNPNQGNALPGLPALRPGPSRVMGSILDEDSPADATYSPMTMSNSGSFYPPGPSRSYHSSYDQPHEDRHVAPLPPPDSYAYQMQMQRESPMFNPMELDPDPTGNRRHTMPGPPPMTMHHHHHQSIAPAPYPPLPPPRGPPSPPSYVNPYLPGAPVMETSGTASYQSPTAEHPRGHRSSLSSGSGQASGKYRKLEPAPTPPHRRGFHSNGSELRTVLYDYKEGIKDYAAVEPPPQGKPSQVRGWAEHNMHRTPVQQRPLQIQNQTPAQMQQMQSQTPVQQMQQNQIPVQQMQQTPVAPAPAQVGAAASPQEARHQEDPA